MAEKRATCLNCMDGRAQLPAIEWIKDQFKVDHVDMITEPGIDGMIASGEGLESVFRKIKISLEANKAEVIVMAGHHDCKGNPVDDATHKEQVTLSVKTLTEMFSPVPVVGVWINAQWSVERL